MQDFTGQIIFALEKGLRTQLTQVFQNHEDRFTNFDAVPAQNTKLSFNLRLRIHVGGEVQQADVERLRPVRNFGRILSLLQAESGQYPDCLDNPDPVGERGRAGDGELVSHISAATNVGDDAQATDKHSSQPGPEAECDVGHECTSRRADHGCSDQRVDAPDEQPRGDQQQEADEGNDEDELDDFGHSILSK